MGAAQSNGGDNRSRVGARGPGRDGGGAGGRDNSRVGEGLDVLERARASLEDLIRINPTDNRCRLDLAKTCDDLAMRLDESGRTDEALVVYGRARDLVEGLVRANPADARIAHEVPRTLGNLAIALEAAGRQNEALAAHDRARELLGMIGDANPTLLSIIRDRAWLNALTAGILIKAGRDAEALPVLERRPDGPRDAGEIGHVWDPRPDAAHPDPPRNRGDPRPGRADLAGACIS